MSNEELITLLGEIRSTAENCFTAAENMPTLPPHIHITGLKGGMKNIMEMIPTNTHGEVDCR